ncbi:MAG TPA: MmcQ/YjbR family DNA-binding protein [Bacteroidia bacterium]|jgi:predicted DNA-binding protein (MmcQ/YjbR family)|nr:MmcQ/YjbR family DNA-binding protein [Bacteroidia bacterium]
MNIEQLRKFCLSLPHVTEDIKWEYNLCFSIGRKMFCITGIEGPLQVSLKVNDEEFEELCATTDIIPAPYLARYKWISVQKATRFNKKEWEHYLEQSYELIREKLPAKEKRKLK